MIWLVAAFVESRSPKLPIVSISCSISIRESITNSYEVASKVKDEGNMDRAQPGHMVLFQGLGLK